MTAKLVCFGIVCLGTGCPNRSNTSARTELEEVKVRESDVREPLGKYRSPKWENVTATLHRSGVGANGFDEIDQVPAKKTKYYFTLDKYFEGEIPVVVFVTPRGQVWVGPEQQFYIETLSGVVGVRLEDANIIWRDSLISKRPGEVITLDGAVERLKEEVDHSKLEKANEWHSNTVDTDHRVSNTSEVFINFLGSELGGGLDLCGIEVGTKILRFDFSILGGHTTGSAWIDLHSRQVLKAKVNGKQVCPK